MNSVISIIFVFFLWWSLTGLILYVAKKGDLVGGKYHLISGILSLPIFVGAWFFYIVNLESSNLTNVMTGFLSSLMIWGWCEFTFLTGFIAGLTGKHLVKHENEKERFLNGLKSIIFNEILLLLCLGGMAFLTLGKDNNIGFFAFFILYIARVSAKLNLFFGVPYINLQFLTFRLRHLEAFCKVAPVGSFFFGSCLILSGLFGFLAVTVFFSGNTPTIQLGYLMLSTLVALAVIEHLFMAIPFRDAKLWNWMLPKFEGQPKRIEVLETKPSFHRENENGL